MYYHLQTLIFLKSDWTIKEAKKYLKHHGYKTSVDEKVNSYRFRQIEPKQGKKYEYRTLTKNINGKIVYYVFLVRKDK